MITSGTYFNYYVGKVLCDYEGRYSNEYERRGIK